MIKISEQTVFKEKTLMWNVKLMAVSENGVNFRVTSRPDAKRNFFLGALVPNFQNNQVKILFIGGH